MQSVSFVEAEIIEAVKIKLYLLSKMKKKVLEKPTCGKVSNLWKFLIEQKSCRLTQEVMISRHMVNRIRLPSFLPGPNIWQTTQTYAKAYSNMIGCTENQNSSLRSDWILFKSLWLMHAILFTVLQELCVYHKRTSAFEPPENTFYCILNF